MIGQELDSDSNSGDPNISSPLYTLPVSEFSLARYGWGGTWVGRIADFQVYDYALSSAEVAYLATDGTGSLTLKLNNPANLKKSGIAATEIVDLKDLAVICQQWRQQILWP